MTVRYLFALLAGTFLSCVVRFSFQADIIVQCEPFVQNAEGRCTCGLNFSENSLPAKCGAPVGYTVLRLVDGMGVAHECKFSEVRQGRVQSKTVGIKNCSLLPREDSDVFVLALIVDAFENVYNGSSFQCLPNCVIFPGREIPEKKFVGLPVTFSPDCRPGMYGADCNSTCDRRCQGGVCNRQSGNCTVVSDQASDNTVAIAVGVAVPAGLGLCVCLAWWFDKCSGVLGLISPNIVGSNSGSSSSDRGANSPGGRPSDPELSKSESDAADASSLFSLEREQQQLDAAPTEASAAPTGRAGKGGGALGASVSRVFHKASSTLPTAASAASKKKTAAPDRNDRRPLSAFQQAIGGGDNSENRKAAGAGMSRFFRSASSPSASVDWGWKEGTPRGEEERPPTRALSEPTVAASAGDVA